MTSWTARASARSMTRSKSSMTKLSKEEKGPWIFLWRPSPEAIDTSGGRDPPGRFQFPLLGKDGTRHGRGRPRPGATGDPATGSGRQGGARSDPGQDRERRPDHHPYRVHRARRAILRLQDVQGLRRRLSRRRLRLPLKSRRQAWRMNTSRSSSIKRPAGSGAFSTKGPAAKRWPGRRTSSRLSPTNLNPCRPGNWA